MLHARKILSKKKKRGFLILDYTCIKCIGEVAATSGDDGLQNVIYRLNKIRKPLNPEGILKWIQIQGILYTKNGLPIFSTSCNNSYKT